MDPPASGAAWLALVLGASLSVGCHPTAGAAGGVSRIVVGDTDTVIVYNRQPIQLPARTIDRAGREVPDSPLHFVWLAGDSIPLSEAGVVVCLKRGTSVLGATVGGVFARIVVQCQPVGSVRMASPVDLVLGDSSQRLQAHIVGLDGHPVNAISAKLVITDQSVVRVEGGRVIPLAAGSSGLDFTVGDESAFASVHVYEEIAELDRLRPGQDHVAVHADLAQGEVRQWRLPAGHWHIAIQPDRVVPGGLELEVEGASCEALAAGTGRLHCLSKAGGWIRVTHPAASREAIVRARMLLRRTRA